MLISDGKLNVQNLKSFFPNLKWTKVPRQLSAKCKEHFYIGVYEDSEVVIRASVRPTRFMQISESFKNRDKNGGKLPDSHTGPSFVFGSTVEVKVPEKFIQFLEEHSSAEQQATLAEIEW